MAKMIGLAMLFLSLTGAASASVSSSSCQPIYILWWEFNFCPTQPPNQGNPTAAPEIDPAAALSGMTLALGGLAVLRGRRLKNSNQ
jgi:hypothetical protein